MSMESVAGAVLIFSFLLVIVASMIGPNEVYRAPDSKTRLDIIARNQGRWRSTNLVWGIASVLSGLGLVLLTLALRPIQVPWLLDTGAVIYVVGAVCWAIYTYQRSGNPEGNLYTMSPPRLAMIFAWSTMAGLALYGAAFLQGDYPNWLGFTLVGSMGLLAAAFVFFFDTVYRMFPPQVFGLLTLLIGIVALRR
jgi:drug/metabolite transporter (DMT)-like permease